MDPDALGIAASIVARALLLDDAASAGSKEDPDGSGTGC